MYYLLKDGSLFRRNIVERSNPSVRSDVDWFIGNSCRVLREYGKGRSAISGIVAIVIGVASLLLGLPLVFTIMVVNFIGGYIPYIGAFLGGGLAVIVALGEGGIGTAVVMLLIVLAANLLVENFIEPKVMGKSLDIHPLVVLVVTALGGLLGGIVGLILAVPFYVILRSGIDRLRSGGYVEPVTDKAQQAVKAMIE
jgi:predicted PurR-regulated permease PerM